MEDLDYRYVIRNALVDRIKSNPSYSARAMARDLRLSSAFFSQVMTGKKNLSEGKGVEIAERLGLDSYKTQLFVGLIRYAGSKDPRHKERILSEMKVATGDKVEFHDLRVDLFNIVSEWYHFAIVELTTVFNFKSDPRWIAGRLGISKLEAEMAVDRLLRVGLLAKKAGALKKTKTYYKSGDVPSEAIREFHRRALTRAADALENQRFEDRDFSAATLPVSISKLPKAKEMIRKFHKDMMDFFDPGVRQAVYQLSIQFYRLDKGDS
ncbi:MAG: TIGR02147 family protein [Bdellovibrionia bacterium]